MRYKLLGSSGLRVSELCLGTLTFGQPTFGCSLEESQAIFDAFAEDGGNFIDTSDAYSRGRSEEILGGILGTQRDAFVVGTKFSVSRQATDPNAGGNHRKNMRNAIEASLTRLRTDHIDVLWVHQWDFSTPIHEVMRALDDLVRAGKVLYVGISDTPAWIIARANTIAEERSWTPFVATQVEYNLLARSVEREYLPMCQALDIAVTAWSPLAEGRLTGKYTAGAPDQGRLSGRDVASGENGSEVLAIVAALADELGVTSAQVALAWLRARPGGVIPVIGARTLDQLRDNLASTRVNLDTGQIARLDEASAIDPGFPFSFLTRLRSLPSVWGSSLADVDNHRIARSGLSIELQALEGESPT